MTAEIDRRHIKYLPISEATDLPGNGMWEVYLNRWWTYEAGKGLLFYKKSPQCNPVESIARKVQEKCHPDAHVIFIERVYVRHDCGDYI